MVLVKYQINLICECKAVSFVRGILSEKMEHHIGEFLFYVCEKDAELPILLRCNSTNTTIHRNTNYCTSIEQ